MKILFGIFDDEEKMICAAEALKSNNITIQDIYTPFPVHGIDDFLDIKRSRLPYVAFIAGIIGCVLAFYIQIWTSAHSWPVNIGGKPFNSFVAFIPVGFEITVLLSALVTVAAFLIRSKFYPGKVEKLLDPKITNSNFVLAIECTNASVDTDEITSIMKENGASEVKKNG